MVGKRADLTSHYDGCITLRRQASVTAIRRLTWPHGLMNLVESPAPTTDTRLWHAHNDRTFRESKRADCACAAIERRHVNAVGSVLYLPPGIPDIADSRANVCYSGRGRVPGRIFDMRVTPSIDGRIAGRCGPVNAYHA